jgi:hypothetical protein
MNRLSVLSTILCGAFAVAPSALASVPTDPAVFPRFTDAFVQADQNRGMSELLKRRGDYAFAEVIESAVRGHFDPRTPSLGGNEAVFSVNLSSERLSQVSLGSHPMCRVSGKSLKSTLGHDPGREVVSLINEFVAHHNEGRERILNARSEHERLYGWDAMHLMYNKLMGCLAYTESLTTADQPASTALAKKVGPKGYSKPSGVKFYYDKAQKNPASALNIGLYQFAPDSNGNLQSCIRDWNQRWPGQLISERASKAELIRILGDSHQVFNAFCGVNKLTQSFHVQVNTTSSTRTHPANFNLNSRGKLTGLKAPADRCVSLHFHSSKTYNHFGPLQNSTRRNLRELLQCALR